MATVYLARATGPHGFAKDVALKLTHEHLRENKQFAADLFEEARIAARINHRNVVQVTEVGEDPLGVFLVMEYVEGDTLSALRRAARKRGEVFPARVGIKILVDALWGLHAAHELRDPSGEPMNLIHRDFSPQNVLVNLDGVGLLTDFGIAKAATRLEHTATGVIKGKLAYMAPEQAKGEKNLDRRTDVWSAGVVAWEILTGKRLFGDEGEVGILLKLVSEEPTPIDQVSVDIPSSLSDVVKSALTMDREKRCPSAAAFATRLTEVASAVGLMADEREVARYAKRMLGEKLAERRQRVDEASDIDRKRTHLAEVSAESASNSGLAPAPQRPTSTEQLPTSEKPDEPPRPPPAHAGEGSSSALRPADITNTAASVSVPAPVTPLVPQRSHSRVTLLASVGAAVVLGGVVAGLILVVGLESAPSSDLGRASAIASSSAPAAASHAAAPASSPEQAVARSVAMRASSPVTRIALGNRQVLVEPPSSIVRLDLRAAEASHVLKATVYDNTGRSVRITIAPDDTSLELSFKSLQPQTPDAHTSKHPRQTQTHHSRSRPHPASAHKKKNDTALAPNPYGGN